VGVYRVASARSGSASVALLLVARACPARIGAVSVVVIVMMEASSSASIEVIPVVARSVVANVKVGFVIVGGWRKSVSSACSIFQSMTECLQAPDIGRWS
jgi:hypothetical protein